MSDTKAKKFNLNMGIANTHQVATQMVGIQLSGSNLLAIAVSAASVVAGTVTLAVQYYPGAWIMWITAGLIGVGLAILIEGMTLGALIRIRIANKHIREIEDKMEETRVFKPGFHPIDGFFFNQKKRHSTRLHRRSRRYSIPLAIIGALASATAGGLFYHTILQGLGIWESLGLAALFALIVTGTFVSSEIFKDVQEKAIKEGFEGGAITEAAIRQETKRLAVLEVHKKIIAYLDKPEAQEETEKEAKYILRDIIQELRGPQHVAAISGQVTVQMEATTTAEPLLTEHASTPIVIPEDDKEIVTPPIDTVIHDAMKEIFTPIVVAQEETEDDKKLTLTLQFLDAYPQKVDAWTTEDDIQLAQYLDLQRVASARFWRLRALEIWTPKTTIAPEVSRSPDGLAVQTTAKKKQQKNKMSHAATTIKQRNEQRIKSYAVAHPDETAQEIATALELSVRTVQRHLSLSDKRQKNDTPRLKIVQ